MFSLFDKLMNSMMIENNIIKWTNIGWVRIWGGSEIESVYLIEHDWLFFSFATGQAWLLFVWTYFFIVFFSSSYSRCQNWSCFRWDRANYIPSRAWRSKRRYPLGDRQNCEELISIYVRRELIWFDWLHISQHIHLFDNWNQFT